MIFLHDEKIFFDGIFLNLISWSRRIVWKQFQSDSGSLKLRKMPLFFPTIHTSQVESSSEKCYSNDTGDMTVPQDFNHFARPEMSRFGRVNVSCRSIYRHEDLDWIQEDEF